MVLMFFYIKVKMTDSKGSDVMVTNLRTEEVCELNRFSSILFGHLSKMVVGPPSNC